MEGLLCDEFVSKRLRKEKVSRTWLADMGQAIHSSLQQGTDTPRPFAASQHWVSNFMARYKLFLRRHTNLTVLSDEKLVARAVSYLQYLEELKPRMNLEQTILMDETTVYFEDTRTQTVDVDEARHVVVRSTGFASMCITVILTVTPSDLKLTPVLVWKGKNKPSFDKINGAYVTIQLKAWVDSGLVKRGIDVQFPLVVSGEGKFLEWDPMRAHISKEFKSKCQSRGIGMCVVPGGLAPYLQTGDIAIYRSFKDIMYAEVDAWKETD